MDYRAERYDWQEIFTADTRISAFSYHPSIHMICGQYSGALRQTVLHIPEKAPTPASSLLRRILGDVELLQFGQMGIQHLLCSQVSNFWNAAFRLCRVSSLRFGMYCNRRFDGAVDDISQHHIIFLSNRGSFFLSNNTICWFFYWHTSICWVKGNKNNR